MSTDILTKTELLNKLSSARNQPDADSELKQAFPPPQGHSATNLSTVFILLPSNLNPTFHTYSQSLPRQATAKTT
jgi:hypothetical protein